MSSASVALGSSVEGMVVSIGEEKVEGMVESTGEEDAAGVVKLVDPSLEDEANGAVVLSVSGRSGGGDGRIESGEDEVS